MKRILGAVLGLAIMAGFLWNGEETARAVGDGLTLCVRSVIPALFPFLVAVSCFTASGLAHDLGCLLAPLLSPLLGCSGAGAVAFLLGLLGGYPVGGRAVAELYRTGDVDKDEAERLLAFCNNCGPSFILGVAGANCFGDRRIGLWLWGIHVAAAVIMALLRPRPRIAPQRLRLSAPPPSFAAVFSRAVTDAASAMVSVCGFVTFFLTLLRLVTLYSGPLPPLLLGAVELTNGILRLAPDRAGFITAAALLGWGGISVHCQTAAMLQGTDLSLRPHLRGKAIQAAASAVLAAIVSIWLF